MGKASLPTEEIPHSILVGKVRSRSNLNEEPSALERAKTATIGSEVPL